MKRKRAPRRVYPGGYTRRTPPRATGVVARPEGGDPEVRRVRKPLGDLHRVLGPPATC